MEGLENLLQPLPRERTAKEKDDAEHKVYWAKFVSVKRVHCYACIDLRMNGHDIVPQRAAWSRKQGAVEVLLCSIHAQQVRDHGEA